MGLENIPKVGGKGGNAVKASETTVDVVRRYYASIDTTKKMDEAIHFFTEDATLHFANNEPISGREAIHAAISGILDSVEAIRHDVQGVWEDEKGTVIFEVDVTYTLKDESEVALSGAVFCDMEDGRFREQRIYVDLAPLFAGMAAA